MITRVAGRYLDWCAARRRRRLAALWRDAAAVQETTLLRLIAQARDTEFGLTHGFGSIRSVADYQARVPLRDYADFQAYWARVAAGERHVTWPGRTRDWVRTPGTTGSGKLIPLTDEALRSHRRGGWDAILMAIERVGGSHLADGQMLLLGGSTAMAHVDTGYRVGDLSGIAVRQLPPSIFRRDPARARAAAIAHWDERVAAIAARVATQDLRLLAGIPPWLLGLFEHVACSRCGGDRGPRDLGQWWPNLRVLVHGGVAFAPYAAVFDEWIGRRLERVEVYAATEGVIAVQTERVGGLTPILDNDIFYEFVPVEDLAADTHKRRRHTVADLELNRPYAVVVTTAAGLWSYALGDTVRFARRDPLRLVITGRTRQCVNVCGENVIVEEVERALVGACRRTDADVAEFTVAPRGQSAAGVPAGHEWLIEFRTEPQEPQEFGRVLDETLCAVNAQYRVQRRAGLAAPVVTSLPAGTFFRWMRARGKLGDQHKVPRVSDDRAIAEALLAAGGGRARPLVEPVPAGVVIIP